MQDDALNRLLTSIPKQPQRQYAADDQLRMLQDFANRLGLYDAADVVRRYLERS